MASTVRLLLAQNYLKGLAFTWVLSLASALGMRLRRRFGRGEAQAVLSVDNRIRLHSRVQQGRDGFLFHRDHDALDQLTGRIAFASRQIDVWIEAIRARAAWCDAHGAALRVLIIPEKHVVYAEHLPRLTRVAAVRPVTQLLEALPADLRAKVSYPVQALRAASLRRPTFQKTDTHWTSFGAFTAYRILADSLASEVPLETVKEGELTWKERSVVGDLGVRFERERGETIAIAEPVSTYRLVWQNHNFGRGAIHVFENERRDLPRCVLFRDSFSNALIPFLIRGFSRIVAVSSLSCHYDLLEQERPDVVLFAIIERFLATFGTGEEIELPKDATLASFADATGTALSDIPPPPD